jgi:2-oxoglutarate dehydrogenase E2 component (dihydrolipoamide succinyltransferase)
MAVEVKVPVLGESIVEATVGRWLKHEGDAVNAGEVLVELETDKINVEVMAEQSGVLGSIARGEGENVGIGDVIAVIEAQGSATAAPAPAAQETAPAAAPAPTPAPAQPASNGGGSESVPAETVRGVRVSPVARRIAEEQGIDIATVTGSGPGGLVLKEDVMAKAQAAQGAPAAAPAPAPSTAPGSAAQPAAPAGAPSLTPAAQPAPAAKAPAPSAPSTAAQGGTRPEERRRMSRRRQTIAARLVEAQRTAAMLTTFNEVDMSAIMQVRARRKDAFKERHGVGLGFMSFFTKAVVGALKGFELLNAEIQGDEVVVKQYYDIGIAVGTDEGLVVPVVRDADRKSFAQIEREIADLAKRARDGKLGLADLQGGTFTITNGGIYGSLMSTPILNTPQVGILGMHKIEERPVVVNKEIVVRPMMYLALSYDHRIVDGSESVRFLVRVKELLEDPESLLLEG